MKVCVLQVNRRTQCIPELHGSTSWTAQKVCADLASGFRTPSFWWDQYTSSSQPEAWMCTIFTEGGHSCVFMRLNWGSIWLSKCLSPCWGTYELATEHSIFGERGCLLPGEATVMFASWRGINEVLHPPFSFPHNASAWWPPLDHTGL